VSACRRRAGSGVSAKLSGPSTSRLPSQRNRSLPYILNPHPLDLPPPRLLIPLASRPGGRCRGTGLCGPSPVEESPGSRDQRWRLTAAGGDPRESATESKPPAGQPVQARVKRCGKSAPRVRQRKRHGKPHREQNRIGAARMDGQPAHPARSSPPPGLVARGMGAIPAPEEWPSRRQLQTEPGLQAGWQFHGPRHAPCSQWAGASAGS